MKKMTPIKIIVIFLAASQLWIILTDILVSRIAADPEMFTRLSMIKGGLYVAVTGALLYWLISRYAAERDRTEKALQHSEQNYRSIISNIKDAFYRTDSSGTVVMASPSAVSMLGYDSLDEIVGKMKATAFYHDLSQRAILLEKIKNDGFVKDYELTLVRKDGSLVPISLSSTACIDSNGAFAGFEGFIRDITERKLAEINLRESEEHFKKLIDFLPDAVVIIDRENRVTGWNKAMEALTGVKAEQMLGKGDYEYALPFYGERRPILIDLVALPQEQLEAKYSHILRENDTLYAETHLPLGGRGAYLHGRARVLRGPDGSRVGAIEVIHDLTDRKRAEQEREKLIADLQRAIAEIKTLQGILPICAYCKKIRDDKGAWEQMESYISAHTDAVFSHGLCEECAEEHFPDVYKKRKK